MKKCKDLKFVKKEQESEKPILNFIFNVLSFLGLFSILIIISLNAVYGNILLTIMFILIFLICIIIISILQQKIKIRSVYTFIDSDLNEIKKYGKWK